MTADERIEQLLKRAGCPMMVVHSDAPATEERHMAYLIDRLEVALENALNERDALMDDLRLTTGTSEEGCITCAHLHDAADQMPCHACGGETYYWIWRGVPDKEDANE